MRRSANRQRSLKPQDLYLLLALLARRGEVATYPELAAFAGVSMSEVHGALNRAEQARLLAFVAKKPSVIIPALKEFLLHDARYAFPAVRGSMVGGIPTAYAAPPLDASIVPSAESTCSKDGLEKAHQPKNTVIYAAESYLLSVTVLYN